MKKLNWHPSIILIILLMATSCASDKKENKTATITRSGFGKLSDGTTVDEFVITNANKVEMKVITYGGIITSLKVPDRNGNLEDVVLGYDNLDQYVSSNPFFGAIVGRYGNRIAKGSFQLDGTTYSLAINNIGNHLHGGIKGFDKVVWKAEPVEVENGAGVKFSYTSVDGEEGYPGNLQVTVVYTLYNDNTVKFDYTATTDKKTVVNLTNHSYFNLSAMKEDILNHEIKLNASNYLAVDTTLIPTGIASVENTPFDFRTPKTIGKDINAEDEQLKNGGGYDHCFILDAGTDSLNLVASVYEPKSGRVMEVYTTEPAVQFYTGNFLDGKNVGKNGVAYKFRTGFCLETEHYPDSPNQPDFPSVVLSPGETYKTSTVTKFSTK